MLRLTRSNLVSALYTFVWVLLMGCGDGGIHLGAHDSYVHLNGIEVSKDELVVFLFIGHSNMQGARGEPDLVTHPRVWNYHLPDAISDITEWEPARDPLHNDGRVRGGPGMPFMKRLARLYPSHTIAVIQNHQAGGHVRKHDEYDEACYAKSCPLYKEIIDAANSIAAEVTLGGIVAMLSVTEIEGRDHASTFSDDVVEMVTNMRADLDMPDLPFLIERAYENSPCLSSGGWDNHSFSTVQSEARLIPSKLEHSAVVESDGPFSVEDWGGIDGDHFNGAGQLAWGELAADLVALNGWFPESDPPTILWASAYDDPNQVVLVFDEYVDPTTSEAVANYTIDNGVTISTATLGPDNLSVSLTTTRLSTDVTYTMTVSNIEDTRGNLAPTSSATFNYSAGGDSTPPVVTIAAPGNGASMVGTVIVNGTAADNVAVATVEVHIDGQAWVATGTTQWSLALDTRNLSDGAHRLTARAIDTAGNAASATVEINLDNIGSPDNTPPTVDITWPNDGAIVSLPIRVTGVASDDAGVLRVEVQIDEGPVTAASGTTSWASYLDLAMMGLAGGAHTLTARAIDGSGNQATSSISIIVSHDPITILAPAGGERWEVGSTQEIQWTTADINDVTLHYSTDNGSTWSGIASTVSINSPQWGHLPWVVPNEPSTQCMIRIQGYFGEAPTTSNGFEITPAGGAIVQGGCSSTPIPWCAVGLVLVWMLHAARRSRRAIGARNRRYETS